MNRTLLLGDFLVLATYLILCGATGVISAKRSTTLDGYFRANGSLRWWSAGVAAFVGGLSAWSFTSGSAKYYESGFLLLLVSLCGLLPYPVLYYIAPKFRRLRAVTGLDVVRIRFGRTTEAFFAAYKIPMGVLQGGLGLAVVGTFASAVSGSSVESTILLCGIVAVAISAAGGAWAVAASDFFQGMIILVIAFLVVGQLFFSGTLGPSSDIVSSITPAMTRLSEDAGRTTVQAWIASTVLLQCIITFNLVDQAPHFLAARDETQCRRMAVMLTLIPLMILPLIAIPAVACSTLNPNLSASFPQLARPHEGAYVWVAQQCLPSGTYGLFLAAVFAAGMTAMDQGLNRNVGFFVLNVFRDRWNPNSSVVVLKRLSVLMTFVFGIVIMAIALSIGSITGVSLFDVVMRVNGLLFIPAAVPVGLGIFLTRTPRWSGWSTVVVAFVAGCCCEMLVTKDQIDAWVGALSGYKDDGIYVRIAFNSCVVISTGVMWFLMTSLFANDADGEEFRELVGTPIEVDAGEAAVQDEAQRYDYGILTIAFGGAVSMIAAAPGVSWLLLVCAAPFVVVGIVLLWPIVTKSVCGAVAGVEKSSSTTNSDTDA